MDRNEIAQLLIKIVIDKNSGEAERSDALLDLQDHDLIDIGDVLLKVINDNNEDFDMRHDACETLAAVWNNQKKCDLKSLRTVAPEMKKILKMFTLAFRPEWASYFEENEPE